MPSLSFASSLIKLKNVYLSVLIRKNVFPCSSQSTSTASGISTYASSLRRTATTNSSEFLCHRETFCLTPEGEEEEVDNNNENENENGKEHQTEDCYSVQQLEANHNTTVDCATDGAVNTTDSVPKDYSLTHDHCLPSQQLLLQNIKIEPQDGSADEREYVVNSHVVAAYTNASASALQKAETEHHFPLSCDQLQLTVQRPLDDTQFTPSAQLAPAKVKKSHHKKKKSQKKQKKKSREHRRRRKHGTSGNNIDAYNTEPARAITKDIPEVVAVDKTPKQSGSTSSNSSSNSNTNSQSSNSNNKSAKTRSSHNSKNQQTRSQTQSHSNGQHTSNHVLTHTPSLSPEDKENFCRQFTGEAAATGELHELSAAGAVDALGDTTGAVGTGTQHITTTIVKKEVGVGIVHDMAPTSNMKLPGRQTNNSLSSLTGNIFIPPALREDATPVATSERAESKAKSSSGSGSSAGHKKHHRHSGPSSGSNASSDASVTAEKNQGSGGGGHKKKVAAAAAAAAASAVAGTTTTAVSAQSSSQNSDKSADE